MELHLPDNVNLRWSSSPFLIPTTCSIKFPTEATHSNPNSLSSFLTVKAKNNSQKSNQQDIQKLTKKHLSHILRTEAAILAIERKANSKKYNRLWPKAVLEALDDAIRQLRWESALKIFGLLRQQHWYEARCQTYTKLLVMLGKCRQPKQAGLLYEVMLTDGLKPTIDCYTALVSAYGLSGFIEKALEIIDHMKSIDECKPDVHTYSVLINCCTKFRRFDMIEHILAEMSYLGIECSVVTYNTIIDGYGKAQMFGLMESTLNDMLESGNCHPDVFTFNSVIGAYGQCGMSEEMEKWFDEFQIMGIRPDVMTFNILIQSYGKVGMYDKMESVLDFMRKRFVSPTVVTFNIVIETFGKAGLIKRMEEFFLNMKHQGMKPNAITYCSLVSAYSKAGLMNKVDSVMRQVDNSDVILDTPFFNCAISAYGLAGNVERMSELFLDMEDRRCKPDNITFATMIHAYNAIGMVEAAQLLENKINTTQRNSGN